jgi:hypothetical protein
MLAPMNHATADLQARFPVNVLIVEDEVDVALSLENTVLAAGCAVTGIVRTMPEAKLPLLTSDLQMV